MLFVQDSWNISSNGYAQISFFLFFFYTENQLLIPFGIAYLHYSVHAGQKSSDIRVIKVDSHQATTLQTLGNAFKLVHELKIPDVREKSLRFRPDDSFNPCLKTTEVIMIEQDIGVKNLVCRKTTNLGCKPVNGKYLFEAIRSIIVNSTGYEHPFTSACQCEKTWLKSHCFSVYSTCSKYWSILVIFWPHITWSEIPIKVRIYNLSLLTSFE